MFAFCYHALVNVISKRGLNELSERQNVDSATREELENWFRATRAASWAQLSDVRTLFPSADQVGHVVIFNIRHNRYRLIVRAQFARQALYVKALMTHKEYDRMEWMKWA